MGPAARTHQSVVDRLVELVDELLDAHCDTVCLASNIDDEPGWEAHLNYLRDLGRAGQKALAELASAA
jgi:hypothetical protein